ncbi:hypothetical protein BJ170DRAFT_611494 [Xylariales sp. AK1849]|nr:hypothetical protein BJ170DRAFT_611494 [Xylariales sp. AK1849]
MYQKLFVSFLTVHFQDHVVGVTETAEHVTAQYSDWARPLYTGDHAFTTFQYARCSSEAAALAVLTNGHCAYVLSCYKPLFDILMFPLFEIVEEIDFIVKNVRRPVISTMDGRVEDFNTQRRHIVVRGTLASGRLVAFDPTGAQFGWDEIIMPWERYAQRVRLIYSIDTIKHGYRPCKGSSGLPSQDINALIQQYFQNFMVRVSSTLREEAKPDELHALWYSPAKESAVIRAAITWKGRAMIRATARDFRHTPSFKLYRDRSFITRLTSNLEEFNLLKHVWLSEDEYVRVKSDPSRLKELWVQRWRDLTLWQNRKVVHITARSTSTGGPERKSEVDEHV